MGTKIWPVTIIILLLLAFVGFWFVLATRFAKAVQGNRTKIVYDLKFTASESMPSIDKRGLQAKTIRVIEHRLESLTSPLSISVQAVGDSAISVQIPKRLRLVDVKKLLTTEGRIQFFWAKNLMTQKNVYRRYDLAPLSYESNSLNITFTDRFRNAAEPFGFTDPRYKTVLDGWQLILDSDDIAESYATRGPYGVSPGMRFTPSGAKKLEAWCRKYRTEGENLAFVLDGKVISVAPLKEGTILTDSAFIDGKFDKGYVTKLCAMIGAGRLPVKLVERSLPAK